jgi:hypothetical protein
MNVLTSASLCLAPFLLFPKNRGMIPYGVVLVAIDCVNGMTDI